ncbi:hypothetical protein JXL21_14020 [Candidatus Bathyarchaeota archaeon]|nr:hypothetical protein [Candidatus Bathyarchaeota archaeon]
MVQVGRRKGTANILRDVVHRRGPITAITFYVVFITTFLSAYTQPDKTIRIKVNEYHEADLELLLIVVTLPETSYFLIRGLLDGPTHLRGLREEETPPLQVSERRQAAEAV